MHAQTIFTTLLTLAASASAATIVKARQPAPAAYSYTVTITSDLTGTQVINNDASGSVYASFGYGDVVRYAEIDNAADNVLCTPRDINGYQVAKVFGGPDQFVDSVTFEEGDGKQVRSISCVPVA